MKYIIIIIASLLNFNHGSENLYFSKNAKVDIFSHALIEDIKAETTSGVSVYNPATDELDFSVSINTFKFDKAFMQQHFNSDYMESDKYPKAIFKGKMLDHVDITKDGTYPVNVAGQL